MKKCFYSLIITGLFFLVLPPSLAVSPSTTPSSTPLDEIQKIREAVQEKVREKLKEIASPDSQNRIVGLAGTIIQSGVNQITIDYRQNSRTVQTDNTTTYIDTNRAKSSLAKLKIGQDVLIMGLLSSDGTLQAKRVVAIDLKTTENKFQAVTGKIVDISKSSPVFVLIPSNNKNLQFQIKTDVKTSLLTLSGQKIVSQDLRLGQRVVCIIRPDEKVSKTFLATKIISLDPVPSPTPKP